MSLSKESMSTRTSEPNTIFSSFPKELRDTFSKLLTTAREKQTLSLQEKIEISELARKIASGDVVVIDFGPVVGYVGDAENPATQQRICELKQIADPSEHPWPLITTNKRFNTIVDLEQTPEAFSQAAKEGKLPEGIHYRVSARPKINFTLLGEELEKSLPAHTFSTDSNEPNNDHQRKHRDHVVQIVIFDEMLPKIQFLIEELANLGVYYIIATSANIHGQSETINHGRGEELASEQGIQYYSGTLDASTQYIPGSYPGLDVYKDSVVLFRPGHFLPEHLDILAGRLNSPRQDAHTGTTPLPRYEHMRPPRYDFPTMDPWMLKVVFSLDPKIQGPFLYACAKAIKHHSKPNLAAVDAVSKPDIQEKIPA